jgi:hypothetical protein
MTQLYTPLGGRLHRFLAVRLRLRGAFIIAAERRAFVLSPLFNPTREIGGYLSAVTPPNEGMIP